MSAQSIYDHAPLGALIRYCDGTPKPPARFTKKLAAWNDRNGTGRLIRKDPRRDRAAYCAPASITLHVGDFASHGVVVLVVNRTHTVDSDLDFEIVALPAIGNVRILQEWAGASELLHLAQNREASERWLAQNRYSNIRIEGVTADERATDTRASGGA